ncbi:MAG: NifU N-terminal domain-containing protein [Chloroflexota bacterium]
MSEYFTFEVIPTDNPEVREFVTNQRLTDGEEEIYPTPESGEVGSPIAQTLFFGVEGIRALTLVDDTLIVTRQADVPWEMLSDDIRDCLRDFFL